MAAIKPTDATQQAKNTPLLDAVDTWLETKLIILREEKKLNLLKQMLNVDEESLTEEMLQAGVKTFKHVEGNITLANAVFGSIKKEIEKEDAIPIVEKHNEFITAIKYEPTLNSKILGSLIREKRDNAFTIWKAKQAAGSEQPPFSSDMFLPADLINVLNVSEEFTVRFTPKRDTNT
jgi:hypothetical protein